MQGFHFHLAENPRLDACLEELGLAEDVQRIRIQNDGHLVGVADCRHSWMACLSGVNPLSIGDIGRQELRDLLLAKCEALGAECRFGCRVVGLADGGRTVRVTQTAAPLEEAGGTTQAGGPRVARAAPRDHPLRTHFRECAVSGCSNTSSADAAARDAAKSGCGPLWPPHNTTRSPCPPCPA